MLLQMTRRPACPVLAILIAAAAACSSASPAPILPTAPTAVVPTAPPTPPAARPTYTLSGTVTEVASREPIEGVEVYCDACGEWGHTLTKTDINGFYIFDDVYAGNAPLLISKPGYGDPPGVPPGPVPGHSWRPVFVSGDTRLDVQLARQ